MDLKIPDNWQGNIFTENSQNFQDHAIGVRVEAGGTNHIHQGNPISELLSASEAFDRVIKSMIRSHHILHKKDFGVIYKLDVEMHVMGFDGYQAMADYVQEMKGIPSDLLPKENNIRYLSLGSCLFPDWSITDLDDEEQSHIHSLAKEYILQMARCGHYHPSFHKIFHV